MAASQNAKEKMNRQCENPLMADNFAKAPWSIGEV
jgi:hypothetical protein